MYIFMTERQKMKITGTGIMVVEFKRLFKQVVEAFKWLLERIRRCVGSLSEFHHRCKKLPPKEKYKAVRWLDRTGFSEKEINLMVFSAFHCRNNC